MWVFQETLFKVDASPSLSFYLLPWAIFEKTYMPSKFSVVWWNPWPCCHGAWSNTIISSSYVIRGTAVSSWFLQPVFSWHATVHAQCGCKLPQSLLGSIMWVSQEAAFKVEAPTSFSFYLVPWVVSKRYTCPANPMLSGGIHSHAATCRVPQTISSSYVIRVMADYSWFLPSVFSWLATVHAPCGENCLEAS